MKNNPNDANGFAYKPGEKIGNYEVLEVLGIGGQSIVYKCYDPLLGRLVAIKQIATHLAQDPKYLEQLEKSIRNLARLGAMNEAIVTIYEMIHDDRGLFYVMEFVEGHTLETLIVESGGPIEPKAVLLIIYRLAAALHDVHSQGIVHRDVKPSNIIMGEGLRPKMIDFGVAAVAGSDISMPLATTKYLAPEVYGKGLVDGRADLYSLGFIAYEMLIGRELFNEVFADIVGDKHAEALRWMKWHGNEAVAAPMAHEVNPAVPVSLSQLVAKMMDKKPANRFADTEELGRAVKSTFSGRGRVAVGQAEAAVGDVMENLAGKRGLAEMEGDEIEIQTPTAREKSTEPMELQGPATVPLPKQPMTRQTKMIILAVAVAIFLGFCGLGVNFFLDVRAKAIARAQQARETFSQADKDFNNESYDDALMGYELLGNNKSQLGSKARLMGLICRAHLAIIARNWEDAQLRENEADDLAKELQASAKGDEFLKWVRQRQGDIERLQNYRISSAVFHGAVDKSDQALAGAVRENDFDMILDDFEKTVGVGDVNLTEKQEKLLADQKNKIKRMKFMFIIADLQRRSDQLQQLQKYDEARTLLNQAMRNLSGPEVSGGLISAETRQKLMSDLEKKIRTLNIAANLAAAVTAVESAGQGDDLAALRKALNDALGQPGLTEEQRKEFQNRLKQVQSAEELLTARALLRENNYDGARQALQRVLKVSPNNQDAIEMLKNIDNAAKKEKLVQAANVDFAARKFADALGKYEQAAALGSDERLQIRIVDCRFKMTMAQAESLGKAGKFDEAADAYRKARLIKPANSAQVDAMVLLLESRRQYSQYISRGNDALKKKKWTEALKAYEEARKIQDTEEVNERIQLTKYAKNMTLGERAMVDGDMKLASFFFRLARKEKDTPEVREKLNKALGGE